MESYWGGVRGFREVGITNAIGSWGSVYLEDHVRNNGISS